MDSVELKKKSDLHLSRKLWHALGVGFMIVIYNVFGHEKSRIILACAALVAIPFDLLRQKKPTWNHFALRVFGPVMRRHEIDRLSGLSWLILGALFTLIFFDQHIVTLTLLFLALGDPVASFFGIRFGRDKIIGNKTLQGTMAAFILCTSIAAIYYYTNNLMIERLLIVAPISGLIGALAELIPVGKLDDNFTFPVISSIMLWILFHLFGGFGV